ncbi:MAG: osmotically inducible protein OsmC [Actinobacteria bacterium RBG_16_64_13]|nr:MAG: osmotically inducible protein OsmC [Actinobacteria bacterium RBG_16_64_13]
MTVLTQTKDVSSTEAALKAALTQTIAAITKDPKTANVVFRADTSLKDGVRCAANVRDFEPLVVDEPPSLGGTDAGMNPVELVLAALGTCQEIVYAAYASVLGIRLDGVSVASKGNLDLRGLFGLDPDARPGYSEVRFETSITSPESADRIQELVALAESRCPVLDILTRPVTVRGTVVLNGEQIHQQDWS